MDLNEFMKYAKEKDLDLLLFQKSPEVRLIYTGSDKQVPDALSFLIAHLCLQVAAASQHEPIEVLESLQVATYGAAKKILEEKIKGKDPEESFATFLTKLAANRE